MLKLLVITTISNCTEVDRKQASSCNWYKLVFIHYYVANFAQLLNKSIGVFSRTKKRIHKSMKTIPQVTRANSNKKLTRNFLESQLQQFCSRHTELSLFPLFFIIYSVNSDVNHKRILMNKEISRSSWDGSLVCNALPPLHNVVVNERQCYLAPKRLLSHDKSMLSDECRFCDCGNPNPNTIWHLLIELRSK